MRRYEMIDRLLLGDYANCSGSKIEFYIVVIFARMSHIARELRREEGKRAQNKWSRNLRTRDA